MDIRKYLNKPKKAKPAPAVEPDEEEEDFQPSRKRSSRASRKKTDPSPSKSAQKPASRKRAASAGVSGEEPVEQPPKPAKKPASKKRAASAGFGGEEPVEQPKKKPRWVPRSDDPPNRGNKPLPRGRHNCLAGCVFVITGVLDSLLREECTDLCKEYGARVVSAVSGKVTHGVVGIEPGASKMGKLQKMKVPIIDEDGLFAMINQSRGPEDAKMEIEEVKKEVKEEVKEEVKKVEIKEIKVEGKKSQGKKEVKGKSLAAASLWVDKYKPANSSELVANPKALRDLRTWLNGWKGKFLYGNAHKLKQRERGDMDWPAAMLVGPPGIGKTTAAHIVCKEAGFEPHEFNASDVRNKGGVQMLAETVMVANTMTKYLKVEGGKTGAAQYPEGQVLIMDEVDGMSGGDRGGSQELIRMIKKSKVPVICIANDDSSANMRSLAGNCFKLKFRRPMVNQVTKRLTSIAMREGFRSMDEQTLAKLAEGCNGDIRQMINLLQTWRCSSPNLSFTDVKTRLQVEGKTVIQRSIFDLAKTFFSPGIDGSQNSLMARTDNYFADSDLIPLFVQENYINTAAASHSLEALADAAECISEGDIINSTVRSEQRWDLMPAAAIMTAIRPGAILAGGLSNLAMFPSFLGNMSKGNKWKRIITGLEMKIRAVKTSSGSPRNFRLDYIPVLTTCLATPLIRSGAAGISEVTEKLDAYFLERDPDWLEILDAGVYGKGRGPLENIKATVKSSFTREYNAGTHARSSVTGMRVGVKTPDAPVAKKVSGGEDVAVLDDDDVPEEESDGGESDTDVVKEFGVKKKKKTRTTPAKTAGRGRGRGRGGGRGRGRATRGKSRGRGRK